jgi:adenylate cyclase
VDPDVVDHLIDSGILIPGAGDAFSQGDVLRVRWVHSFEDAGMPLAGMASAVRDGKLSFSFLDASAFARFAALSDTTFEQLSKQTGVPFELLSAVREAVGAAEPEPEDRVRDDELAIVPAIEFLLSTGIQPAVVEQWVRLGGESMRRIAEAETDWWKSEVEKPLLEEGMTEAQMLQAQADVGSGLAPLMEQALLAMYHGQQDHAWSSGAVEFVERALEQAGLLSRVHRPPAVSFLDMTGYTRLTEERGDEAAADLAGRLAGVVRRSSREHGGRAVKWLGDGVMFYFPDPAQSVVAALDMVEGVANDSLPPAHVGIDAGPVVFQEGDYFGRTVNNASRIADYARPGEVLVTQQVVEVAGDAPVTFTEIGPVELKGVSGTRRLHAAHRAG